MSDQEEHPVGALLADSGCTPPAGMERAMKLVTGAVDCGLFIGMAERVYIGGADGVQRYDEEG